ncbi:DUF4199 domain-containing protein [Apibacter muscae]|uniref:DUF4199 family protein n=1 Tax=Apibacter muscae TaxID=2509004 RepID=UPI0011AD6F5E|nr:DUF4199 family protein [Apibacter muscae]TWP22702.1 DUF4199 domain-containing protein [Apibacter muscae]
MKNSSVHYGVLLGFLTLVLFFLVYFLFIGQSYYILSLRVNFFILPALYTLIAVILLYKKTSIQKLSFADCFTTSFSTMFIGGTVSFIIISLFLNYVDKGANEIFGHQLYTTWREGLDQEFSMLVKPSSEDIQKYHQYQKLLNWMITEEKYFFNLRMTVIILGMLYTFYLIISVFLSMFFRLRNPHATIRSNTSS